MTLSGFDISNVNGPGIIGRALTGDFVICKTTEGLGFVDKLYPGFMAQIRAAGKLAGSYHFAHWANSPTAEAAFYGAHNDRRPGEFEILDWEMYGGQAGCPAHTHGPWVAEFLNARPRCGLYTNADMMGKIIASADAAQIKLIRSRVFWKATVGGATPGNAYGFDRGVSIWQYRDTTGIDEDTAFLTPQEWRALANGDNKPPQEDDLPYSEAQLRAIIHDELVNVLRAPEFNRDTLAQKVAAQVPSVADVNDVVRELLRAPEFNQATLVERMTAAVVAAHPGLTPEDVKAALAEAVAEEVTVTGSLVVEPKTAP